MIKKLHFKSLLLMATLVFGVGNVWGDTSTLTFNDKCGGTGTADDGVEWTVDSDGSESNFDSTKGIHYGTNNASVTYIELSTSGIAGTITQIVVNASTANGVSATVSTTVGGVAFGGEAQSLSSTATNYTFNGSASGNIKVTVTKPSSATKALYVKSITVTYTTGGGNTVYSPAITPATGTYNNVQNVSMTCDTEGATIYYTTDGSTPTTSSSVYSAPFAMTTAGTVMAYAVKDDMTDSSVASATYTYEVADPVFSVAAGTIIAPQDVTITTETAGATIYYTTDESTPDETSTAYTGPIHVDANTTIKAIAMKDGFTSSAVKTAAYTFFAINAKNINSGYFEKVTNASTLEDGDCILIVNEDAGKAMSTTQNTNNRGIKDITLTDKTTYAPKAEVQKLILKKVTEDKNDYFYFYTGTGFLYAASSSSNHLKTEASPDANAKASISISSENATIEFQGSNTHNLIQYNSSNSIFSCYSSSQQPVQIYKEVAKNAPLTISDAGFATYCSAYALDFSDVDDVTAYTASLSGSTVTFNKVTGSVPAGTGLLLKGAADTYNIPVVASSTTDVSGNKLVGVTAATVIDGTSGNFFVLKKVGENVGFYKVNNAAYTVRANTAYLNAEGAGAKDFIGFDDGETTSIESIHNSWLSQAAKPSAQFTIHTDAPMFNLSGQRVSESYKGIVIVNGKKVIRK